MTIEWDELKQLAFESGITNDEYGDPRCGGWDCVMMFAKRIANDQWQPMPEQRPETLEWALKYVKDHGYEAKELRNDQI